MAAKLKTLTKSRVVLDRPITVEIDNIEKIISFHVKPGSERLFANFVEQLEDFQITRLQMDNGEKQSFSFDGEDPTAPALIIYGD